MRNKDGIEEDETHRPPSTLHNYVHGYNSIVSTLEHIVTVQARTLSSNKDGAVQPQWHATPLTIPAEFALFYTQCIVGKTFTCTI